MASPQIVWLRRDLRLADQAAFHAAAQAGPVIPVYVLDDKSPGEHALGGAARWWLHHSLDALGGELRVRNSRVVLRRGNAAEEITKIAKESGARCVHAIHHYEPWWRTAEEAISQDSDLCLHHGNYLMPPGAVTTNAGAPYKIYTPFSKALLACMPPSASLPAPDTLHAPDAWPVGDALADWNLLPTSPDWASGLREVWEVGEDAAHDRLEQFAGAVSDYQEGRNLPSIDGSSKLSPHLHWGELSPGQVWHRLEERGGAGWATFARELIWRDFAQNVICEFPDYPRASHRRGFSELWRDPIRGHSAAGELEAWQQGRTGYPIVDAGMRQLWRTGWMHNRVRMISASFLVKHLLIDWRHGEQWFWNCLVDADYGNNGVNWQWIAGTGVDSNMFVRIMAPLSQSEKFDAAEYIREFVPELAGMSDEDVHDPPDDLRGDYPPKIIGHRQARERALAAYRQAKSD